MIRSYSRKEVGKILGITDRTVWFYTEQKIVTPEVHNPRGKGTTRLYSPKNIMKIAVARKLADHGLRLELVGEILKSWRLLRSDDNFNPWDPSQNIESGGSRYFLLIYDPASKRSKVVSLKLEPGQDLKITDHYDGFEVCMALDLTTIWKKLSNALS